jgi:hypothetical protein
MKQLIDLKSTITPFVIGSIRCPPLSRAFLVGSLLLACFALSPATQAQSVYAPASVLAAKWWEWALETPAYENPLTDTTGQFAGVNQPKGPVWFLAGNTGGATVRTFTVPAGKALFFPIVNVFDVEDATIKGGGVFFLVPHPVQTAQAFVAAVIATATGLSAEVDGTPIPITTADLEQSTPFSLQLPADNILGVPAGAYFPAIDSGYYVLLRPLSVGQHTIHWAGSITFFPLSLDVTYNITVQ